MLGTTTRFILAALVASAQCARVLALTDGFEAGNNCTVQGPLGEGQDDTDQVCTTISGVAALTMCCR